MSLFVAVFACWLFGKIKSFALRKARLLAMGGKYKSEKIVNKKYLTVDSKKLTLPTMG